MSPGQPSVWGEFPNTILYFHTPQAFHIDLREPIPPAERKKLDMLGLGREFGIMTAYNPFGKPRSGDGNAGRAMALQHDLTAMGTQWVPLDACSPDRSHCEGSVAITLPCDTIVAMACRYQQLAIFWFDGDRFWIVPALATAPAVPLPEHDRAR